MVSRDIRHKLGEYFTPDWLAELLLNEVGYDGNPDKRVLDPACGSGTFLVLTIRRIREYAREHFLDERNLFKKIIENVRGIDLNPLAVLASKANYLIALSDLLRYRPREGIEIPIYLADSISVIRKATPYGEEEFELNTNEGKFWVTKEVIDKNLLNPVLSIIATGLKIGWSGELFEKYLSKDIPLSEQSVKSFIRLYNKILKLEKYGKNRIWTQLLKNSFSPMLIGKFDYVIGNPPWINWENLPEFYRESTKHLWDEYGLISKGGFKKDIAMLFVARCYSSYVDKGGKLAFLVPFTIFKNPSGGGYRAYLANKCEVEKIHDLVELYPFEGAINRTAMIVLKDGKSHFPLPCLMWSNPKSRGIDMEDELEQVKRITRQTDMVFTPIRRGQPETPWMIITEKGYDAVEKVLGESEYVAQEGTNTRGANAVFYVNILDKQHDLLLVKNDTEEGRTKYRESKRLVDDTFVFPLIRGNEVKRWYAAPKDYILLPHDNESGDIIAETQIKTDYVNTFKFLNDFRSELESRKFYGEQIKGRFPFYTLFQVNAKTFSRYKVIWKSIAGKISGKPQFDCAVIGIVDDKNLGKKAAIPNESLVFIPFDNLEEAHYCVAILNSSLMKLIVASYTIETRIPPNITKNVFIPRFNHSQLHLQLSKLGERCHELAKKYYEQNDLLAQDELKKVEEEIDNTVAKLYGITDEELEEIKKTLRILKEGEAEGE